MFSFASPPAVRPLAAAGAALAGSAVSVTIDYSFACAEGGQQPRFFTPRSVLGSAVASASHVWHSETRSNCEIKELAALQYTVADLFLLFPPGIRGFILSIFTGSGCFCLLSNSFSNSWMLLKAGYLHHGTFESALTYPA